MSLERIGLELEAALDQDTCYVCDVDSGKTMDPLMSFGGDDKQYIGTGPNVLGWGMAAAFGAKLARPDLPVVSVVGDGSFCFSGPQPLWTQARYKAPVLNIVLNNHSYNNERNRIWHYGGKQFKTGRDMTCYLGSPDIDYAKSAEAFGVEGEVVKEPGKLKDAIERAQRVIADGRPYLLDIHTYRDGIGAVSTWHPPYSIAGPAHEEGVTMKRLSVRRRGSPCSCSSRPRRFGRQTAAALPPGDGRDLVAIACSQCHSLERHHGRARRAGRMEAPRLQHGAARRATDAARGRHRARVSRRQFRPRRAGAAASGHAAGRRRQGAGRDALRGLSQPRARHRREAAGKRDWETIVANMYDRWGVSAPDEAQAISGVSRRAVRAQVMSTHLEVS